MLIWIKAPCVAIGVLAILALLLSSAVSEDISTNLTSTDNTPTVLVDIEEPYTVQLMQLPFINSITNPCSSESSTSRPSYVSIEGHRAKFAVEFFKFISHYTRNYKEDVRNVLRNHTISGCETLHVTNLPDTPTLEELQDMNTEDALNKIYSSLLMHSAYAFFIHHQFNNSAIRCSEDIHGEQNLANESYKLALKQKSLACYIRVGIAVLGYNQHDVSSLLNETITDLTLCSRRALRDCQVMNSIFNFLSVVTEYTTEIV